MAQNLRVSRGAGIQRAAECVALPAVSFPHLWAPAAVDKGEDFPQNSPPQQDVYPGVQNLVPGGHTYHGQQSERGGVVSGFSALNDHVNLAEQWKQ